MQCESNCFLGSDFIKELLFFFCVDISNHYLGGYSIGVPPLPIPNREVKPDHVDGTALLWESR